MPAADRSEVKITREMPAIRIIGPGGTYYHIHWSRRQTGGRRGKIARPVSRDVAFDAAELARAEVEDGVVARGTARRGCARKGDGERGRSIMAREPVPRLVGGRRTDEERAPGREWDSIERVTRVERGRGRANEAGGRGQLYRGDLDANGPTNELFKALFDIRHDFIKHSSNVQTLYIELYLRPRGLLAPPFSAALPPSPPRSPPARGTPTSVLPGRLRTSSTRLGSAVYRRVPAQHTMRISSRGTRDAAISNNV